MLNRLEIIGNVGKDPEQATLPSGAIVVKFPVATTQKWKTKQGEAKELTEWHNVVMYDKLAEIAMKYVKKGGSVYVSGSVKTSSWDKDGVKHYRTELIGKELELLGGTKHEQPTNEPAKQSDKFDNMPPSETSDDLPF